MVFGGSTCLLGMKNRILLIAYLALAGGVPSAMPAPALQEAWVARYNNDNRLVASADAGARVIGDCYGFYRRAASD